MNYSVWNRSLGKYNIYDGSEVFPTCGIKNQSLGSAPEDVSEVLPSDAVFLYTSNKPIGKIVEIGFTPGKFLCEFAMIISAGILSKYIYDRWIK